MPALHILCQAQKPHRKRHHGRAWHITDCIAHVSDLTLLTSVQEPKLLVDNCKIVEYAESGVRTACIMDALQLHCTNEFGIAHPQQMCSICQPEEPLAIQDKFGCMPHCEMQCSALLLVSFIMHAAQRQQQW